MGVEETEFKALVVEAFRQLESEAHPTLPGLRRRYYWRGNFMLMEHLSAKAAAWNVARLRRLGEHKHAARLEARQRRAGA